MRTGLIAGLIVVATAALMAGCGGSSVDTGAYEQEISRAKREVAAAKAHERSAISTTEAAKVKTEGERNAILNSAEDKAQKIVGHAKAEAEELEDVESRVAAEKQELADVMDSLHGAQQEKRMSKIPGDGTFKLEADYVAGTYRAPGGPGCYWATLNSADPYDIASNENASGPTIADIDSPYFQTEGCGTWERIGE